MIDAIDRVILARLQADGRMTHAALAREVGMTAPAVQDRVRRLEAAGVIRGYRADVDAAALGEALLVVVSVSLDHHGEERVTAFRAAVDRLDEVVECLYLTGTADFLLKVRVRDVADYQRWLMTGLSEVPGVDRVRSSIVLATFKDDPTVRFREEPDAGQ